MANGVCDKFCKGCIYCQLASGDTMFLCTYFLTTNIRRPCPAGTGCTVRKEGRAKGAWEYKNDAEWAKKMQEARKAKAVVRNLVCPECGTEFETTVAHQVYCSKRCNNRVVQRKSHRRKMEAKANHVRSEQTT